MLEELKSRHATVSNLMSALGMLLARDQFPCMELATIRLQLSRASSARSRFIAETVGPALLGRLHGTEADGVRQLLADALALSQASSAHIVRWNAAAVAADWPGYAAEARTLLAMMEARVAREAGLLYPLLQADQRAAA